MIFNHSGALGDILYSLTFAREYSLSKDSPMIGLNLQVGVPTQSNPQDSRTVLMSKESADWLKPLLVAQPYIHMVTVDPREPQSALNLSRVRRLPLFHSAGDIRYYYYCLVGDALPKDFAKPVLDVTPDPRSKDRVIVFRSARYHNPFVNYNEFRHLQSKLLFLGLPEEHEAFCKEWFKVEYLAVKDALEAARLIKGASLTLGNQTCLFAIAEQLKVPRVLESAQVLKQGGALIYGCPNVLPVGGDCKMWVASPKID